MSDDGDPHPYPPEMPNWKARAEKAEADLAVTVTWLRTATDGFSWPLTERMDVQFCGQSMGDDAATLTRLLTEDNQCNR